MEQEKESSDDAMSEQMARDIQLAYELQAEQEQEDERLARELASAGDGVARASASSSYNSSDNDKKPMFAFLGNAASPLFRKPNAHLEEALNDGSAAMEQMGSLLYVPCEINGRVGKAFEGAVNGRNLICRILHDLSHASFECLMHQLK